MQSRTILRCTYVVVNVRIGLLIDLSLRLLQVVLVISRVLADALNVLDHIV